MKLLLDTHTLLWHATGDPKLSASAAALLASPANDLFLSVASVWEMAIKSGLGKLSLSGPLAAFLADDRARLLFDLLPISEDDCAAYEGLAFPGPRHRDPFDRMLVTQSARNAMPVVGDDPALDTYGITRLW